MEPMWRHVDGDPSHDVIIYKASDVKSNVTTTNEEMGGLHGPKCGNVDDIVDSEFDEADKNTDAGKSRYR